MEYDICKDEMICGEIQNELTREADRYHWRYEYISNDCYKSIEAQLDSALRVISLDYNMKVGKKEFSAQVQKDNRAVGTYLINGREVKCLKNITVFEMVFLIGQGRVFENSFLYNPPTDDFATINIRGNGDKYTVLFPGLGNLIVQDGWVESFDMPREGMIICRKN